jgi:hypothetical protein
LAVEKKERERERERERDGERTCQKKLKQIDKTKTKNVEFIRDI